ncbi:TetR family transcriptional regulator [Sphingomonas oryzagri]
MSNRDIRRCLQEAALELFRERGYGGTTATEIAARIGVSERTFFRYFASKRDVLFDEEALHGELTAGIEAAPKNLPPMQILHRAFRSLLPLLERNRPLSEPAREVIARTPELQERYLAKVAATTATVAASLRAVGVEPAMSELAAASGMAVISQAMEAWSGSASSSLETCLDQAFQVWDRLASQRATVSFGDRPIP